MLGERGVSNRIGVLPSIDLFDTAYFGIHRQQATFMDPMQRLVLERAFEALIDAGRYKSQYMGSYFMQCYASIPHRGYNVIRETYILLLSAKMV